MKINYGIGYLSCISCLTSDFELFLASLVLEFWKSPLLLYALLQAQPLQTNCKLRAHNVHQLLPSKEIMCIIPN